MDSVAVLSAKPVAVSAAALFPHRAASQGVLDRLEEYLRGELKDLKDNIRQEAAKLLGMETYVYGYPLVIMDVTRAVMTAAPKSGEYGAPINQFTRMLKFVDLESASDRTERADQCDHPHVLAGKTFN
jgi:hypothetical protein